MRRSAGCSPCSIDPAHAGTGRVEDRIAAVRVADAVSGQDAVEQLRRHSPVPYFNLPRISSTSGRPSSLASTTSIGRRSSSIMCGCEQPPACRLVVCPRRPWRRPRPRQAWRHGRSLPASAVARAVPGAAPASPAAQGDRQNCCQPAPRRGRCGPAPTAAEPFSTSPIRPKRRSGARRCLRRPSSSGTEAATLADIERSSAHMRLIYGLIWASGKLHP